MAALDGSELQWGRPTKLTPFLRDTIASLVQDGNTFPVAARAVGIGRTTIYDWLRRGRVAREALARGEQIRKTDRDCLEFLETLETAEAASEVSLVQVLREAVVQKKDVATAKWLLDQIRRERCARDEAEERRLAAKSEYENQDPLERRRIVEEQLAALNPAERARVLADATIAYAHEPELNSAIRDSFELRSLYKSATGGNRGLSDEEAIRILEALGEVQRGRVDEPGPTEDGVSVDEVSAEAVAGQRLGRRPPT